MQTAPDARDGRDTETMKVLCIVYENIDDWDGYDRYRGQVMPTLEPFGGRFLVRGGAFTTIEGEMPFERIAVLEFPSRGAAEDWYQSPAYQAVLPIRLAATRCQFVVVDAVDD